MIIKNLNLKEKDVTTMNNNFFVCPETELKALLERENKNHESTPKIYYAGFTRYCAWLYEDGFPDSDITDLDCYCVDYSDGEDDKVYDKFFNHMAQDAVDICKETVVSRETYSIEMYFNDDEYCCLDGFWHTAEMSKEDIECLKDLAS